MQADSLRTGRPSKEPAERRSESTTVYLTPAERTRLETLAKDEGTSLAELILRPWRREKEE